MTHFQGTFDDPIAGMPQQRRTSGLAITALVISILGIIPCCGVVIAPIGALLGIVSIAVIGSNPEKKGKGLAVAAIIVGVVLTAAQVMLVKTVWEKLWVPVLKGPEPALTAGFAGDIAGFKSSLTGGAAAASDEEVEVFLSTLEERYGKYVSCRFDEQRQQQNQQFGQPEADFNYLIEFENETVRVRTTMVFYDEKADNMPMRPRSITVLDSELGDLTFPPPKME